MGDVTIKQYTILQWVFPVTDLRLRQNVAQLSLQNSFASLSYKANMFHVVMRLFSNRSHGVKMW